ncbi:MAG: hypothetical protein AB7N76_34310 [Planctomycetota bacterium]
MKVVRWWLDEPALPELRWAREEEGRAGAVRVVDCDGREHRFPDAEAARSWLREEEYSLLEDLVEDGELPADTQPPARWPPG